ncbi:MAG: hypothetical protein LCH52_08495 [Bacteroidetes bacterium]|nr:hypothetical protein [Bacteroidota bacterium]
MFTEAIHQKITDEKDQWMADKIAEETEKLQCELSENNVILYNASINYNPETKRIECEKIVLIGRLGDICKNLHRLGSLKRVVSFANAY